MVAVTVRRTWMRRGPASSDKRILTHPPNITQEIADREKEEVKVINKRQPQIR